MLATAAVKLPHIIIEGDAGRAASRLRRLLGAVFFVRFAIAPFDATVGMATSLHQPPGLMTWLPGPLSASTIIALRIVGLICAISVMVRRYQPVTFAVSWTCLLVLGATAGSFGKVMHNEVMLLLVGAAWLAVGSETSESAMRRVATRSAGIQATRASIVIVSGVYFFTGYRKLVDTGWRWAWSDNLSWVLHDGAAGVTGWRHSLAETLAHQTTAMRLLASAALIVEVAFPLCIWIRSVRLPFTAAMACLHLSIYLFVGLDYSGWALTALAVMAADFSRRSTRRTTKRSAERSAHRTIASSTTEST